MQIDITLTVNGRLVSAAIEPQTLLVELIRKHLQLTGTHVGCDTTQCGCCIVHVDGMAVKSCTMLAVQADGSEIVTIEGLAKPDGTLHPVQEAFRAHNGLQCGYCTPGMIMMGVSILRDHPDADETTVRHGLEGNLCRCTGYQGIVDAILDAAAKMSAAGD